MLDTHFRELLFADPDQALAGYDLTREERAVLLSVDAETLDAFAERLWMQMARKGGGEGRGRRLTMMRDGLP